MRTPITLTTLLLTAAAIGGVAFAQSNDTIKVQFHRTICVAQSCLPAGEYTIHSVETGSDSQLLRFESEDGTSMIVQAMRVSVPFDEVMDKTQMQLERNGERVNLKGIRMGGRAYGYEFAIAASKTATR